MLIKVKRGWELPDRAATHESVYRSRRTLLKAIAAGPILASAGSLVTLAGCDDGEVTASEAASPAAGEGDPSAALYPVARNERYKLDRDLTPESQATTYNNFYEFGSHKEIWPAAQKLKLRPWSISIEGLVEKERTVDIDDLLRAMPLEERLYRHRCVEAWAMAVPWSGFAMTAFVDFARPLGSAKYVRMESFHDSDTAPGQLADWYPWPYVEGLTIAEATNELAFLVTGLYGKPVPKQNGAPLRLAVPWKYGFKSAKSIVRFRFTEERPRTFWEEIQPNEYGFWANVNPEVRHPRWSQAEERLLGDGSSFTWKTVPTQPYNGYGEFVAGLYAGAEGERLFM